MAVDLRVCGRPEDDGVETRHQAVIRALTECGTPWHLKAPCAPPEFGRDMTYVVSLGKMLSGAKGFLTYRFRNMVEDVSADDDKLDLTVKESLVDWTVLAQQVVPRLVHAMSAYRAYIGNAEFDHRDFARSRGLNLRDHILRFGHICFFDETLCKRALSMTPSQVRERLGGVAERVEILGNGVYIVARIGSMSIAEAEAFDSKCRVALGLPPLEQSA